MSEAEDSPSGSLLIRYVPEDADQWSELSEHLAELRRQGIISGWHHREVSRGPGAGGEVDGHLESSTLVLWLVSPQFLESAYCDSDEACRALQLHAENRVRVIPVLLQPVDLRQTTIGALSALPAHAPPIDSWPNRTAAFDAVAQGIRQAIEGTVVEPKRSDEFAKTDTFPESKTTPDKSAELSEEIPSAIGRYTVERVLGQGTYGRVYLARDAELDRHVAIKVPQPHRISKPADVEAYLNEARLVARLDHPGLVPVFDVGRTDDNRCYVVSKLIEGTNLQQAIQDEAFTFLESAQLVYDVAESLNYAHEHDLVHRDIKPANILIDGEGRPHVADFGLAVREEDFGKGAKYAGTPAYMSPEQARGEGHRVDGRSDVFSLGVVLYELLTGRRPFRSSNLNDLLSEISTTEARPPRQLDPGIPPELERICLKAMANRLTDRYTTAHDLAGDLRYFVEEYMDDEQANQYPAAQQPREPADSQHGSGPSGSRRSSMVGSRGLKRKTVQRRSAVEGSSRHGSWPRRSDGLRSTRRGSTVVEGRRTAKIVPKGLRSFDLQDSDFFLELLPGPRDRYGIPDSIRFWKSQIESPANARPFAVGLIYGPSGCGKSSFVRAGLVPRLDHSVVPVFLEATASDTELSLRRELQARCPPLPRDAELDQALSRIRRGEGLSTQRKLLIIIDQFEQWLHAQTTDFGRTDLLGALRQCDGQRVQCLLLSRVDYMMGIHRFMQELEIPIQEGQNSAAVDLFDVVHARNVLAEFGRAYGRLPQDLGQLSDGQQSFLAQSVGELAENEKIIPVNLSVFAEMFKGRDWSPNTLKELGGARGVGVKFLEDTFESATAPLQHRVHEKAARAVLKTLLPPPGTNIKGNRRSYQELLHNSGYEHQPQDFATLTRVLDHDLRMITPTGPAQGETSKAPDNSAKYYELTHDYLVSPLRQWLARKQQETRRGRAEARLQERAAIWNSKPKKRHLPSLLEFLNIRWLTRRTDWTKRQADMMRHAARHHGIRAAIALTLLISAVMLSSWIAGRVTAKQNQDRANGLVDTLSNAELQKIPGLRPQIAPYQPLVESKLRKLLDDPDVKAPAKLNFRVVLLETEDGEEQIEPVFQYLLTQAKPEEVPVLRDALSEHKKDRVDDLWQTLEDPVKHSADERLRAASALAVYDPSGPRWTPEILTDLVKQMISVPPSVVGQWADNLKPIGSRLLDSLREAYLDPQRPRRERTTAADLLGRYGPDQPAEWTTLLAHAATPEQFQVFFARLHRHADAGSQSVSQKLAKLLKVAEGLAGDFEISWKAADDLAAQRDTQLQEQSPQQTQPPATESGSDTPAGPTEESEQNATVRTAEVARLDNELLRRRNDMREIDQQRDRLASQTANLAVALLRMAQPNSIWPLLAEGPDQRLRTALIHRLGPFRVAPQLLLDQLEDLRDLRDDESLSIRKGLLLALGTYAEDQLKAAEASGRLAALNTDLEQQFREDPDPGIHAAARWLLCQRGKKPRVIELEKQLHGHPSAKSRWYVDSLGQTMIVFPAGHKEFFMGSPLSEPGRERGLTTIDDGFEKRHLQSIHRGFAVSATEVTVEQFLRFRPDHRYAEDVSPQKDCPVNYVTWYDAARYCNWLSQQAGIPEDQFCYAFQTQRSLWSAEPVLQVTLADDYLTRCGYRLPSESEWEYACRAGTTTCRHFGESDDFLPRYAWYLQNSEEIGMLPVASLLPNGWGLFDLYGNASEWCLDRARRYASSGVHGAVEDGEDTDPDNLSVDDAGLRVIRGGVYHSPSARIRSAFRDSSRPVFSYYAFGFRVARTLPEETPN